jgi:hypothetical protein
LFNGGALHESNSEVVVVVPLTRGTRAQPSVACSNVFVAAGGVAAVLNVLHASNTIAANLEVSVDAASQARLNGIVASAVGEVSINAAYRVVVKSEFPGNRRVLSAAVSVGATAVSLGRARAGNIQTLYSVNNTTLVSSRVVTSTSVAALVYRGIITLSNRRVGHASNSCKLGVFGWQAAGWFCVGAIGCSGAGTSSILPLDDSCGSSAAAFLRRFSEEVSIAASL